MIRRHLALATLAGVLTLSLACSDDSQAVKDSAVSDGPVSDKGISGTDGVKADSSKVDSSGAADSGQTNPACKAAGKTVVSFSTDDSVKLEADLYLGGGTNAPAVVLLHMVPPSFDRTSYPKAFIDALTKRGLTVLNLDRRGGGKSGGVAAEAYSGPKGKLDAKAAYAFLAAHACPIKMDNLVFIGASNGTTTALDFAVYANTEATIKLPKGLVYLTGGSYTENQNKIASNRKLLDTIPTQFVYSTVEATWSASFKAAKAALWEFVEYAGVTAANGHGSKIFTSKSESIVTVAKFVETAAKK